MDRSWGAWVLQASRIVGKKSIEETGAELTELAGIWFGQHTIRGTRIPPSYAYPLPLLRGALSVGSPLLSNPPLSLVKITIVLSVNFHFSRLSLILRIDSSTDSTMAAYLAFCLVLPGTLEYLAATSGRAWIGVWTA